MRITALVENKTKCELKSKHGLSLYIETKNHNILFDLGPDNTLFDNAKIREIDLSKVDAVFISHGHMDHGGALERFLQINSTAKIYVQREAFEPHYSKHAMIKVNIGIKNELKNHPQVVLLDGDMKIDDELNIFIVEQAPKCYSDANNGLYSEDGKDKFAHEQNLIIRDSGTVLITGCGHTGIVNIMEKAQSYNPQICVGGYHLYNPLTKKTVPESLLSDIAEELKKYTEVQFYTCHCTGEKAYNFLSKQVPNMNYLSCGEKIEV